ncbi:MAG: transcription-repair coupling factor [Christensenellaceae bacterium]|nr:transcription-repair coupling factor [Christensenellaceae bacterium]
MKCITASLEATASFGQLLQHIQNSTLPASLTQVPSGARAHLACHLARVTGKTVLFVSASDYDAHRLFERCYYQNKVYLPAPHVELRVVEAKAAGTAEQRVAALCAMKKPGRAVFLSMYALLYKMRPMAQFFGRFMHIAADMIIKPRDLLAKLGEMGYERTPLLESPGFISGRGEIVEVFPPDRDDPIRITFFDDEIESIRSFSADSQRSFGEPLAELDIPPASDLCLSAEDRQTLLGYLRAVPAGKRGDAAQRMEYDLTSTGGFPNIEAYSGIFEDFCTVADLPGGTTVLLDDAARLFADFSERRAARTALFAEVLEAGDALGCETDCHMEPEAFAARYGDRLLDRQVLQPLCGLSTTPIDMGMKSAVGFRGNLPMLAEAVLARIAGGWQVYLMVGGKTRPLSRQLEEYGLLAPPMSGAALSGPGACVVPARLEQGFEIPETKTLFLSEQEIFGAPAKVRPKAKKAAGTDGSTLLLGDLKAGDIIVHEIHGKGRFLGLKNMDVGGTRADYIELEYRDGDKLYIQTAQIHRVQKYIGPGENETIRLSKLGGKEWDAAKNRARSSVKELAEDLVELYRQRSLQKGFAFGKDTVWQQQFEDSFDYEETPGQVESIEQIKKDMESARIMDRLLLGDVGYGKTEVAMRACFKAVMDSKQVAVLVPTTLLARQHYETFKERFAGFPVRIGLLSRYTKNAADIMAQVADGRIDIIIGTHKLLNKAMAYKDLGLLVIDEEQRFGVSHKERIKDMKRSVDVLTLTATPIPRTLEMAMTGIRDMSTIATPPRDRKEVRAFVAPFSWSLVREAILKELQRGGQVYFVVRKITGMDEIAKKIMEAVPGVRLVTAHGQMSETQFDKNVTDFYEHRYDVLLCTTIIESGIDIPSVNTIIVYEADKFGLAQLYQLKGRVGRSAVGAYAYFTHKGDGVVNEAAAKRLEAIREFTQFGSGFKIAMRDLEIRGAGNILGAEQSGHMAQVGYSLYCKLVKEQVETAMGRPPREEKDCTVELGLNAFIPTGYIGEEAQRLDIYRQIQAVGDLTAAKAVREALTERFGKPPQEVENLLGAAVVRAFAARAGMASVIRKAGAVEMRFDVSTQLEPADLARLLASYGPSVTLRHSTPPVLILRPKKGKLYTEMLQLMDQIRRCIAAANPV